MHTVLVWVSDMNIEEAINQLEGCGRTVINVYDSANMKFGYDKGMIFFTWWTLDNAWKEIPLESVRTNIKEQCINLLPVLVNAGLAARGVALGEAIAHLEKAAHAAIQARHGSFEEMVRFGDLATPELILELIRVYNEPRYYPATA